MGLGLTKAFDCVTYSAIFRNLSDLNIGVKAYHYVDNFLSDRTARLGGIKSYIIHMGSRGTL